MREKKSGVLKAEKKKTRGIKKGKRRGVTIRTKTQGKAHQRKKGNNLEEEEAPVELGRGEPASGNVHLHQQKNKGGKKPWGKKNGGKRSKKVHHGRGSKPGRTRGGGKKKNPGTKRSSSKKGFAPPSLKRFQGQKK